MRRTPGFRVQEGMTSHPLGLGQSLLLLAKEPWASGGAGAPGREAQGFCLPSLLPTLALSFLFCT